MLDVPAFGMRVGDLPLRPLVASVASMRIRDAAARMAREDTASVVVVDDAGVAIGIVTDSDLRRRVVAGGLSPDVPLSEVMSAPVVTVTRDELGLAATQRMLERRIHHLVVVDDRGLAIAVVADSDIVGVEADRPLFLARRIERAAAVGELAAARASYPRTVRVLLASGAGANAVAAILAETNDRVAARILELAHGELGPAPAPYAWLCMGTEGRRSQTLRTDQDNGIVWSDGAAADAEPYFARLSGFVVAALERTGAPRCPGNVMATNPLWRGPISSWRQRFERWFAEPQPEALISALIAFDFRGAAGDRSLATDLREWLTPRVAGAHRLLAHIAAKAAEKRPPLGRLGGIALQRAGPSRGSFDAKVALAAVVDGARLLALENGIAATRTLERIDLARARGAMPSEDAGALTAADGALQLLRLRAQLACVDAGRPPDNDVYPGQLVAAERAALREHLHAIERFRQGIEQDRALALRSM